MDILYLTLLAGLLFLTWKLLYKSKAEKLIELIPGPKTYPFIGNLLMFLEPREERMKNALRRRQEFGPIMRAWLGPISFVAISTPEHLETILSSTQHITKGRVYQFLQPWLGTGLLTSTGQKWHTHRKLITPTFHFKILDSFVEVFREQSEVLVHKLEGKADTGEEFDVYPYITLCALDIICETAMGTKVDAQQKEQSPYVTALYSLAGLIVKRNFRLWLHPNIIFNNTQYGKQFKKDLDVLHGFTERVIEERKNARKRGRKEEVEEELGVKRRQAFLDLLLEEAGGRLTDLEIRDEVDTFMFEGHDTTTAGICWTLFLLGHHQNIQDEVFSELQDIFQDDPARAVKMGDLGQMKLLERVIKESLRIYPSVPFVSRQLQEDMQLGGHTIPKNTVLNIQFFVMHRDPELFPDPDRFDPDRFLPENVQKRHPYAYTPFSAGPRNCIGQKFALLEEKVVLSTILRRFKLESVEKREEVTLITELILRPGNGVKLKLTKRE